MPMHFDGVIVPHHLSFPEGSLFELGLRAAANGESVEDMLIRGIRLAGLWGELLETNHPATAIFSIFTSRYGYVPVDPQKIIDDMQSIEDKGSDDIVSFSVPIDARNGIYVASGIYDRKPELIMAAGIAVRRSVLDLSYLEAKFCFSTNGNDWFSTEIV